MKNVLYIPVLEQRLEAEKSDTNKEQQRLHSLIAMLETQLSEKQRDIDKVSCHQECNGGPSKTCHSVLGTGGSNNNEIYFCSRNDGSCARINHGSRLSKVPLRLRRRHFYSGCRMIGTNSNKPRLIDGGMSAPTYTLTMIMCWSCVTPTSALAYDLLTVRRSSSMSSRPFFLGAMLTNKH